MKASAFSLSSLTQQMKQSMTNKNQSWVRKADIEKEQTERYLQEQREKELAKLKKAEEQQALVQSIYGPKPKPPQQKAPQSINQEQDQEQDKVERDANVEKAKLAEVIQRLRELR